MALQESFSFDTDQKKLACSLVHPEKDVRDATIANMANYLANTTSVSDLNMLKLWKALYYCLWLTDKEPMQQEVCSNISKLIHVFPKLSLTIQFIKTFYVTILREWTLVDQWRVNKLYILMRYILREIFTYIVEKNYSSSKMEAIVNCLRDEVLTKTPNGIRFHMTDIYLEELVSVTKGSINSTRFLVFIQPYLTALTMLQDAPFYDRIINKIFTEYLTKYSIESTTTALAPKKANGSNNNKDQKKQKRLKKVNTKLLQAFIFELASSTTATATGKPIPEGCRKRLYGLHKDFQKVTGVQFVTVAEALAVGDGDGDGGSGGGGGGGGE